MKLHYQMPVSTAPRKLFETLADENKLADFIGAPAEIDSAPGGDSFILLG